MANKYHVLKFHQIESENMQKNDTYSPHMNFVISLIFYFTTAFVWAITFGNPSINDWMALIWNLLCRQWGNPKKGHNCGKKIQVPSSNGVGCGDDTDTHTDTYSHWPNNFTTAFVWAITFGNPSINDWMAMIWN